MKIFQETQRVVNYRVLKQNLMQFLPYKIIIDKKYRQWRLIRKELDCLRLFRHQCSYFRGQYRRFDLIYLSYFAFWQDNIAILRD